MSHNRRTASAAYPPMARNNNNFNGQQSAPTGTGSSSASSSRTTANTTDAASSTFRPPSRPGSQASAHPRSHSSNGSYRATAGPSASSSRSATSTPVSYEPSSSSLSSAGLRSSTSSSTASTHSHTVRPAVNAAAAANAAFASSSSSSASSGSSAIASAPIAPGPPLSPTKERIRMAGIRSAGVGGSHFKQKGDEESKIQVMVRVRGLAPGEAPPPHSILATEGPHCSSVRVRSEAFGAGPSGSAAAATSVQAAHSVQSSLVGDGPQAREKVYPFDHVFGPEADQGMVYQSAVGPILNEVMSGYNCTVFAYGQTGTGKTHTMEGDLASNMGTYSPEAGIIPRTLYRLFHTLELSRAEFSVHASFVELYNEELRDLLSDEAPQPLGSGGGTSAGLRMFEDSKSRGGVVIQGLEDAPMRDAEHGLRLLRKGSQKRQIAATRCNESSSRSHSVFTLTVYIKETTPKGEDVLRTGKLNLVDLAGSENIGRSGAENKRAREAGMINQSLLTLGRVINALVEKTSHVPYRESKLTRLLQDSLGGRTKTCIIATVSGDRRNLEETLSTLDYALRAKSIRNKPEVNQRMTRAALIKEYVGEIERLKGDLLASREKNGIFLSPESWATMQDEHEVAQTQIDEMRRQSEVVESKMVSLREQFEQNMQLLVKRENEAKSVRTECKEKEEELQRILGQFEELRAATLEERTLREAYMRSERRLDSVASGLRNLVQESTGDVGGLFAKLDRKSKVEKRNRDVVAECQASLMSMSNQLEARVADFGSSHEQFTMDMSAQITEFRVREQEKLKSNRETVETKLQQLQNLARSASKNSRETRENIDNLVDAVRREGEILAQAASARNEDLHNSCQALVQGVVQGHKDSLGTVRQGMEDLSEMVLAVLRNAKDQSAHERKAFEDVRALTNEATEREFARLRVQNERLATLLLEEREKATGMRDTLCKNIGQLVLNFCQQREQSISSIMDEVTHSNATAQDDMQSFAHSHTDRLDELLDANQTTRDALKERERAAKSQRIRGESGLNQSSAAVERQMHDFTGRFFASDQESLELVGATLHNISSNVDKIREHGDTSRQADEKSFTRVRACAEEGFAEVNAELQSTLEDVEETCEGVVDGIDEHSALGVQFMHDTNAQLGDLRETARDYLSARMLADLPTGTTPQKKEWPNLASWTLVKGGTGTGDVERVTNNGHHEHLALVNGDDSLASMDGDVSEHPPMDILRAGKGDALLDQRGSPGKDGDRPYAHPTSVRPSLPAVNSSARFGAKSGAGVAKVVPLGEQPRNRATMAVPPSTHSSAAMPSKARAPGGISRGGSVAKRPRQ